MMRVLLFLTLIGVALGSSPLRQSNRIVGGEPTTIERYPFVVNMQRSLFQIFWSQACGGTLITSRTIVSAAHCYFRRPVAEWRAIVGSTVSNGQGGVIHVLSDIRNHEEYTSEALDPDVAIVILRDAVVFNSRVGVARIAGFNYNLAIGTPVTAVGYGTTSYLGPASDVLQHVEVNIVNHEYCTERYAYLKTQPGYEDYPDVTSGMLCAGLLDVGGKDACQGDSGGPLVHNGDILVGITSWGFECARSFYPGVNARVSEYSHWIAEHGSLN